MKILISILIGLAGLIGPGVFLFEHHKILLDDTPIRVNIDAINIEEYVDKIVILENACTADYSVQVTKDNLIKTEIFPLINCDSINQKNIKIFLRIESASSSVEDIYKKGRESEYGLFIGKLEKSQTDISSGSGIIIEKAGFRFDPEQSLQLVSHFTLWDKPVDIWVFLITFPIGAIIFIIRYNKKETQPIQNKQQ